MQRAWVRPGRVKSCAAVVAERLARLKLNGRVTGYFPLSRFTDLEMFTMGIEGSKQLWATPARPRPTRGPGTGCRLRCETFTSNRTA